MAKKSAEGVYKIVEVVGVSATSWEDAGRRAVETAAESLREACFGIRFDRAGSFAAAPRAKLPLVLRGGKSVIPLIAFQHALGMALAREGFAHRLHAPYTPHMTLLYDGCYVPPREVAPLEWTARSLVLVHSLLGRTRHVPLASWPLA